MVLPSRLLFAVLVFLGEVGLWGREIVSKSLFVENFGFSLLWCCRWLEAMHSRKEWHAQQEHFNRLAHMHRRISEQHLPRERKKSPVDCEFSTVYVARSPPSNVGLMDESTNRLYHLNKKQSQSPCPTQKHQSKENPKFSTKRDLETISLPHNPTSPKNTRTANNNLDGKTISSTPTIVPTIPHIFQEDLVASDYADFRQIAINIIVQHKIFKMKHLIVLFNQLINANSHLDNQKMKDVVHALCTTLCLLKWLQVVVVDTNHYLL